MVLVGLEHDDGENEVEKAARRIATLRVFEDDEGKMNRGLDEIGGKVLAVSQFTLAGSIRKGRRPSFDGAMPGQRWPSRSSIASSSCCGVTESRSRPGSSAP